MSKGAPTSRCKNSSAEDPVLLMYTSGTTGNPKGVLHVARYVLGHNGIDYSYNYLRDGSLLHPAIGPGRAVWLDGLLAIWPYGIPVLAYRSKARFDPDVATRPTVAPYLEQLERHVRIEASLAAIREHRNSVRPNREQAVEQTARPGPIAGL